jgi:hypothetical protein
MPTDKKKSAESEDEGPLRRANPVWAFRLIVMSCVVGAALVAIGLWGEIAVTLDGILSTTFMVSGLALIFGAFGSQATVQYKGWVIAGVAAIALIFLFAIDYLRRDSYVIVELLTSKAFVTTLKAGEAIIKGTVESAGQSQLRTRFVVRYRHMDDLTPRFDTEWPKAENQSENPIVSLCFTRDKLIHWFGRGGQLEWRLLNATSPLEAGMEIRDQKNTLIGSRRECGEDSPPPVAHLPGPAMPSAHAEPTAPADLINDLLSDNPDVRRLARDRLAAQGPSVIRPLMDRAIAMTASNDRLAFRMQVGAAVVIDTMLSNKGRQVPPATVSRQLNARDFGALVSWTLNNDLSLRDPAVRVVANTADVAALHQLMQAIENQTDATIIFNTAWILRQSAQRLRSNAPVLAEIKQLARQLRPRARTANTTSLLDQIEAM